MSTSILDRKIVFFMTDDGMGNFHWSCSLLSGTKKSMEEYLRGQIAMGDVKIYAIIDGLRPEEDASIDGQKQANKMFEGLMLFCEKLEVEDWGYYDDRPPLIDPFLQAMTRCFLEGMKVSCKIIQNTASQNSKTLP